MTAVQIQQERVGPTAKPARREVARKALLLCGVLAPALYVAMLVAVPIACPRFVTLPSDSWLSLSLTIR